MRLQASASGWACSVVLGDSDYWSQTTILSQWTLEHTRRENKFVECKPTEIFPPKNLSGSISVTVSYLSPLWCLSSQNFKGAQTQFTPDIFINMIFHCGVGEDSWESLGPQGDPTSPSYRKSVLNIHRKDWCWSWNSNTLATYWEELTYLKRPWCWERLKAGGGDDKGWDG